MKPRRTSSTRRPARAWACPAARFIAVFVTLAGFGRATGGDIRFADVTAAAGLESALKPWRLAHSGSWGDVTGDGLPDLFVGAFANPPRWTDGPPPNMLFLSTGDATFALSPQEDLRMERRHARPSHVLMADLDQDGDLDMMIACHASRANQVQATLWENLGDGRFRDVTPTRGYWPAPIGYRNVAAVDLDGDGLLDVVACDNNYSNWGNGKGELRILINKGRFEFADGRERYGFPADGTTGLGLAVGDVNDDGRPDFFVADCNRLFVSGADARYREACAGAFTQPQGGDRESHTCGAVFGDLDGDGRLDLVTTEHGQRSQVRVYLNGGVRDGMPAFRNVTRESGLEGPLPDKGITGLVLKTAHVAVADMDNDGRRDIWLSVVWRDESGRLQPLVIRNLGKDGNGVPRFGSIPRDRIVVYYATAPVADFDRDGRLDCFMAAWHEWQQSPSTLFRNVTEGGNWLTVQVRGRDRHNTMGIGAVVRAYEVGRVGDSTALIQRHDIAVGTGYSSGEEALAHLGLGTRGEVDVEVRWGDRAKVLPRQPANRLLTVDWE